MNDQNPEPIPSPIPPPEPSPAPGSPPPKEPQDWREQRRQERWARRDGRWQGGARRHTNWFWGALLILAGLALLLQQTNLMVISNWWAVFILIPAFWCFVATWEVSQAAHRFTRRAAGSLVGGILFTLIALAFLFNINLTGYFWPVLLLLGGLALLVTVFFPE